MKVSITAPSSRLAKRSIACHSIASLVFRYGEYYFRLLHFMLKRHRRIVELPAIYLARTSGSSKSRFLKMMFTYLMAAVRLRYDSATNREDESSAK